MKLSILWLAVVLAGCAASPVATSPASTATPGATVGTASAQPISLEGHILLTDGGLYVANADGSERQLVYAEGAYCCINRLSPDETRVLVMPGDDFTGAVRGGTLTLDGSEFKLLPQPDETLNLVPSVGGPGGLPSRAGTTRTRRGTASTPRWQPT